MVHIHVTLGPHELTNEQKLNIIKSEYGIPTEDIREEVSVMCNLSQGIKEEGIAIGEAQGIAIGESRIMINMHNNGFTNQQIADVTDKELQEIEKILVSNTGNI